MIPIGSPAKILFLAMDAGDSVLIESWAADGTLKTFRNLLSKGLVGNTMSLEGFFEGSTWPSFYTGVAPGRHGFHRLIQLNPGSYEFYRCYPGDFIKEEPFWDLLSRSGRKVAILDIPLSGISKDLNGIQMVEWGSHDPNYGFCTLPKGLKRDVLARFGHYPMQESCDSVLRNPEGFRSFRDHLIQGVQRKTALTKYFLDADRWDFFAQVFTEAHCMGHQCWHLHDPGHPSYDPETAAVTGDPVRAVYIAIDAAIGEILTKIDDNTLVVFLASHRMGHNFGAQFLLPEILIRLQVAQARPRKSNPNGMNESIENIVGWGRRFIPDRIRKRLIPFRNHLGKWVGRSQSFLPNSCLGIDIKKSKCFPLDNGLSVGGIRLNLAGREQEGIIRPGAEMDAFCEELSHNLLKLIDFDSGTPMVRSVRRTDEMYRGKNLVHLPDLLVEWSDERAVGSTGTCTQTGSKVRLFSEKTGIIEGVNSYCRTGDHRPQGMFIAFGRGVKAGRLERTVSLMDFAPTFAKLLEVNMPLVDGEPINEVLEAHSAYPPY